MVTDSSCDFPTPDSIYSFNGGVRLETREVYCTTVHTVLTSASISFFSRRDMIIHNTCTLPLLEVFACTVLYPHVVD